MFGAEREEQDGTGSLESSSVAGELSRWEDGDRKREFHGSTLKAHQQSGGDSDNQQPFCCKMEDEEKVGSQKDRSQRNRADRERENRYHKVLTGRHGLNKEV